MVLLTRLLGWIITPIGTYAVGAVVLLAAWQGNNYYQRQQGASETLVRVEKQTRDLNAKATTARRAAERDPSGVLKWCRDC